MLILDDLWNGNVQPSVRGVRSGSQYEEYSRKCEILTDQLRAGLTEVQKDLLDKLLDADMSMDCISEQDAFICGVRIGARLILDAIGEYKSQLPLITG